MFPCEDCQKEGAQDVPSQSASALCQPSSGFLPSHFLHLTSSISLIAHRYTVHLVASVTGQPPISASMEAFVLSPEVLAERDAR